MKRLICLLLMLLALTGCGGDIEKTEPDFGIRSGIPTEPPGSYTSDSSLELFTEGAVRAYPQRIPNIYAIAAAGEDLLVFSGRDSTTITRLTGENLFRVAEKSFDVKLYPDAPGLLIVDERLVYYDPSRREMIWLDEDFREFYRLALPEDMVGVPVISADQKYIYYCTLDGVRVLDVGQGITRILREFSKPEQSVSGLLLEDTVVKLSLSDGKHQFLDAATGQLIQETEGMTAIYSNNRLYYGYRMRDGYLSLLCGSSGEPIRELVTQNPDGETTLLPGAAVDYGMGEDGWQLDYYDLKSGLRRANVVLPEDVKPWQYTLEDAGRYLYFLSLGAAESQIVYRWDLSKSQTDDEKIYTSLWYTADEPDRDGLTACQARADALSQRYGLDIRLYDDAVAVTPEGLGLARAYRIPEIELALQELESTLSAFPQEMLSAALETLDGTVHLCLVGSVDGGCNDGGTCFRQEKDAYIVVTPGENFREQFLHQLFHVMESRILSNSIAYYRWDELENAQMPYEEERAELFATVCMEEKEDFFASETMQRKLQTLCKGIREGFDLKDTPEVLPWEQYLQ